MMLLEENGICVASAPEEKLAVVPSVPGRSYFVTSIFGWRYKKTNTKIDFGSFNLICVMKRVGLNHSCGWLTWLQKFYPCNRFKLVRAGVEESFSLIPEPNRYPSQVGAHLYSKKSNGAAMRTGVGSDSRTPTPSPVEGGGHKPLSRFAMIGRLFKPWKWKRKKKSDKFEQTSRTLERKISMRSTKDELIKKGVLLPDGFEKDKEANNKHDSLHQNHIPQMNGFVAEAASMADTDKQMIVQNVTSTSSSTDTYNMIIVTSVPTALTATPQSNAVPVIHNVSLLNLPDVEEVPSHDGEILLSVLPEPPISVNDIGPIPPPPMFSNPSPLLASKFHSQPDQPDQSDSDEEKQSEADSPSPCIVYVSQRETLINTSTIEEIPAKEPHPMNAMPKKSALKKKGPFTCAEFQKLSIVQNRSKLVDSSDEYESRPVPTVSVGTNDSDSDSDSEKPILWKDYYGDDEERRKVAKVARKDSLALKLAQRPNIQELIDKNIYIAQSEQESQESKEDVKKKLTRRLSLRPTPEELEQRNILKYQSAEELRKEKEQKKKTLIRKLSFRPTIEELKERKIIRFNDYVEVTQAQDYDRRADKPWTRLTPRAKAAIRQELNEFKRTEMEVHEESRHFTRFHRP